MEKHINRIRINQRDRLLGLLKSRMPNWVPLPDIIALGIANYTARIHELRCLGFRIPPPRVEVANRQRRTWYHLESWPPAAAAVVSQLQSQLYSQTDPGVAAGQSTLFEVGDLQPEPRYPD
jgi:hypothetical protein